MSHTHHFANSIEFTEDTIGRIDVSTSVTISGVVETNLDVEIDDDAEGEFIIAIDVSEIQSLFILSEGNITISTNDVSTGLPDDTIVVLKDVPFIWPEPSSGAIGTILAVDITSIWIRNDSGENDVVIKWRSLVGAPV